MILPMVNQLLIPSSGRGKSFSPLDLDGLTMFIDAQSSPLTFSSGNLIATVGDLSGNGNNLADGSGVNKFAYQAEGYHGKPAYRMNGARATLENLAATLYGQAGSVTVFYTLTPLPMSATAVPLSLLSGNALVTNRTDNQNVTYTSNQASQQVIINPGIVSTEVYAVTINFTDNANAKLTANGVASAFDPNNAYYTNGYIRFGAINTSTNAHPIELYGAVVTNTTLSDAEVSKLQAWGTARYL